MELRKNRRSYAPYWDFRGDRAGTEVDVVNAWIQARFPNKCHNFVNYEHRGNPKDPPDVVVEDKARGRHGFEVSELVDSDTIREFEKNSTLDWKQYSDTELVNLVKSRIQEKDNKPFKDEPYVSKRLILYSAEPELRDGALVELEPSNHRERR